MPNNYSHQTQSQEEDLRESAQEIEQLRAEIERLKGLLTVETNYRASLGAILNDAIYTFRTIHVKQLRVFGPAYGEGGGFIKVPRIGVYDKHPDAVSNEFAERRDAAFALAHKPPIGTASNDATNDLSRG